ncbi:hypothetical protein AN641_02695 [Candidatus Epulonipiscioides gigas]|nr:hypothetical protein AN641_02695 [Epulopiscium sp. SCG-C07WGA-EpuloA2]
MEIKFKLTFKDMLRYNLYVGYKSLYSKLTILIGILAFTYILYSFFTTEQPVLNFISKNIIIIILIFFALFGKFIKIWQITALQASSPLFQQTSTYKFEPDNIYLELGEQNDTIPWSIYKEIKESNKDFRFFVDKVQAQIVPKHVMSSEQIQNLRAIIIQAVPKEKYILKG